jgi:hypothetical protein
VGENKHTKILFSRGPLEKDNLGLNGSMLHAFIGTLKLKKRRCLRPQVGVKNSGFTSHARDAASVAGRVCQGKWAQSFRNGISHAGLIVVDQNRTNIHALTGRHSGMGALQAGDIKILETFFRHVFFLRIVSFILRQLT